MKTLLLFSLKRRFLNKSTVFFNLLVFLLIGGIFFADGIVNYFSPASNEPLTIYLSHNLYLNIADFPQDTEQFVIKEYQDETLGRKEVKLSSTDSGYQLISAYGVDLNEEAIIRMVVVNYQRNQYTRTHDPAVLYEVDQLSEPVLEKKTLHASDEMSADRQTFAFMIVTSIYFMTLSFCTSIAVEVIYEKTGKILDLMLTIIPPRQHFYAKMLAGWLAVILQSALTLLEVLLFYTIRNQYDYGKGLLHFLSRKGLLQMEADSFAGLFRQFGAESGMLWTFVQIFVFLFLGILLIQLLMTILASRVHYMEEGAAIQTPCYLILMLVYYLALSMNDPYQMGEGAGKILSFLPFFSMLFMPNRIILSVVSPPEILISLLIAVIAVLLLLYFGTAWYEKGILSLTGKKKKSLLEKVIRIRQILKEEE